MPKADNPTPMIDWSLCFRNLVDKMFSEEDGPNTFVLQPKHNIRYMLRLYDPKRIYLYKCRAIDLKLRDIVANQSKG